MGGIRVIYIRSLRDGEHTVHSCAAVGLAVVGVVALRVELHYKGIALIAKLILHRDFLLRYACRDGILIEDDIVGATLVVDPLDGVTRTDRSLGREELESSTIGTHIDHLRAIIPAARAIAERREQ